MITIRIIFGMESSALVCGEGETVNILLICVSL
jgi:hypothetical protein